MPSPALTSAQYTPIVRQPKYHHLTESQRDAADNRAQSLISDAQRTEVAKMIEVFCGIDVAGTGAITPTAFSQYVKDHPAGWPLVDLFRAKTLGEAERELLVRFWFRKLDVDGSGTVSLPEFIDMYLALHNIKNAESLYVEFLINLFDDNMDGKIDRLEFVKMMHVLFGCDPPQSVLANVPEDGLDRDGLFTLLHSVAMEHKLLPDFGKPTEHRHHQHGPPRKGKRGGGVSSSVVVAAVVVTAVVTAAVSIAVMSSRRGKF